MSSRERSGKSFRISSSVIPPARYSRMSYTVILEPLMHGLPLLTDGLIWILSCQFMRGLYLGGNSFVLQSDQGRQGNRWESTPVTTAGDWAERAYSAATIRTTARTMRPTFFTGFAS
jgi:hypothetical protein